MKAAIVNPYWDTLGGGEKYTISFAKVLADAGYSVYVEWPDTEILGKLEHRFGMDLSGIKVIPDVKRGDGYEVCFWVSDGSVPTLRSRVNILHFQVPFRKVGGKSLLNRMKLFRINSVVCNSYFTKKIIDEEFGINSRVVYPPVAVADIKPKKKKKMILSVGRFSQLKQAKRQDVLVDVFKRLYDNGLKDWEFVLAGGAEVGADKFLRKLYKSAENYPITIKTGISFREIKNVFGEAKVFWTAAGYGMDENKDPDKVEHFGIAVVEAMGAGAVPLVFKAGGHKEIVENDFNGFLWEKKSQLSRLTKKLIDEPKLMQSLTKEGVASSKVYEFERFEAQVLEIVQLT
jgi:glycosyltransferase involved in cell wall biosynthesis